MKPTIFTGCATAMITPFTPDKKDVDYAFAEKLFRNQITKGINGLVIAGTTGESPVLTDEEKKKYLHLAVTMAKKTVPVIAGTGSNDTQAVVRKSNDAEKEGVDGLLIVTPFYNKCTQDSVVKHYFYIADRVSTPIIVYNVPSRTGFNIKPETYLRLSEHKNIVGVKEANPDVSSAIQSMMLCGDKLDFYSGNDDLTLPLMAMGAKGVISVASNIIPDKMTKLTDLLLNGDYRQARVFYKTYIKFFNALFYETNPIPVKAATSFLYQKDCPLRLPLDTMSKPLSEKLFDSMRLSDIL